jgi:hypothetical protein
VSNTYQKSRRRAEPDPVPKEIAVPEQVIVSMAEIAESAREGLLALAVGTGLQVMTAMFDEDVTRLCGPDGKHNADRVGYRHGTGAGSVTVGGRRIPVTRPRVRGADGSGELHLPSYDLFSSTEILSQMAMERMLAGPQPMPVKPGRHPPQHRPIRVDPRSARNADQRASQLQHRVKILPRRAQRDARLRTCAVYHRALRSVITSHSPACWDASLGRGCRKAGP